MVAVRQRFYILLLVVAWTSLSVSGQQYFFQSFGQEEGFPVSTVNDIAEDPLGFIWVATEGGGLARFDGQNASVYNLEDGLPSEYVTALLYVRGRGLVIGTEKGIVVYNGYRFERMSELPEERVITLCEREGNLHVVYRRSIELLKPDGTHETLQVPGDPELMSVACADHLFVGASNGLWRYDGDHWEWWWEGRNVRSIFIPEEEEYKGTIQVGAADDVYLILRKGVGVRNLSEGTEGSDVHPDVRDIVFDRSGRWWYGSYQEGLRRYESSEGVGPRGVKISEAQGLNTPKVRCLYVSSDNRIWIGGLTGLSRLVEPDLFRYTAKDGLSDERIHAVYQASNGDWWIGGLSGLTRRDRWGAFESFDESNGLPSGLIFDITETSDGKLWIATENGLAVRQLDRFRLYGEDDGLGTAFVFDIDAYPNGDLAVATTQGIYRFSLGRFNLIDPDIAYTAFSRIQIGKDGSLWAMDIEGRILHLKDGSWSQAFSDEVRDRISPATFQIENGVIWMGTNGHGLWRLANGRLDSVVQSQGLLSNNVWSIDARGNNVWIGTELGIQNLIWKDGWQFGSRVSEARGFGLMECNPHSVYRTRQSVLFGTNQGLLVAPLQLSMDDSRGVIRLLGLELFLEQPGDWSEWSDSLSPWTSMPLGLVLPYDQNYLRFSYSALSVADAAALQYEYRMSPLNGDWIRAEDRTEAIYTSVPPGRYTFEVRAYDPLSGRMLRSDPYRFVIRPPFWKTWWFYLLAVLAVGGAVVLYVRIRLRRIRIRLALEEERNDLERRALRLQMNPHFVFNALDAISGFIFKNEPKEAVKYLNNFAKLMRLMLESSREHLIPLHTEIQLLENYLALEKLRFSGEFESEIVVDDELDIYGCSMPSMMVQPHVENAILHGLRPRGGGKVTIHFEEMQDGEGLRCVVEDNGVGRQEAAEIRKRSGRDHRSLAGEISRRRVELFEKTFGGRSAVITQDLFDESGKPSGTRVVLQLPLKSTDDWDDE